MPLGPLEVRSKSQSRYVWRVLVKCQFAEHRVDTKFQLCWWVSARCHFLLSHMYWWYRQYFHYHIPAGLGANFQGSYALPKMP